MNEFKTGVGVVAAVFFAASSVSGNALPQSENHPACYDPANIGSVAQADWLGCADMLIVDTAMLRGVGSTWADGNEAFYIMGPDGNPYTFLDVGWNIFTGQVTDFSRLFMNTDFQGDIGYWDTSGARRMDYMFAGAYAFNQPIDRWNTSQVWDMRGMFMGASNFDQNVGDWDTSRVADMSSMFLAAHEFNQDLNDWDVSNVQTMNGMFRDATSFDQNVNGWDLEKVEDTTNMFLDAVSFQGRVDAACAVAVTADWFAKGEGFSIMVNPKSIKGPCP